MTLSFSFSFSSRWRRSARNGPYALHPVSQQSPQGCPRNSANNNYLFGWTRIVLDLGEWNVGRFLSPLLFPSGDHCCDAPACPCSDSSSSLWALLPCQAADQMRCLLCLSVYLPVQSHWLRLAQDSRSTEVFVAEDDAWLCASQGSPFQTPPFAGGRFIESVRMMACAICASRWEASHCIACVTASMSMARLWSWLRGHHCLRVQSFHAAWPWTPNLTGPLWLSRPCRSRCHVACCWLRRAFVFCTDFSSWLFTAVRA